MREKPRCFDCRQPADTEHHVVPRVKGGRNTVPLCAECHDKIHGHGVTTSALVKEGLRKAVLAGKKLGRPCNPAAADIISFLRIFPDMTYVQIAGRFKVHPDTVMRLSQKLGMPKRKKR